MKRTFFCFFLAILSIQALAQELDAATSDLADGTSIPKEGEVEILDLSADDGQVDFVETADNDILNPETLEDIEEFEDGDVESILQDSKEISTPAFVPTMSVPTKFIEDTTLAISPENLESFEELPTIAAVPPIDLESFEELTTSGTAASTNLDAKIADLPGTEDEPLIDFLETGDTINDPGPIDDIEDFEDIDDEDMPPITDITVTSKSIYTDMPTAVIVADEPEFSVPTAEVVIDESELRMTTAVPKMGKSEIFMTTAAPEAKNLEISTPTGVSVTDESETMKMMPPPISMSNKPEPMKPTPISMSNMPEPMMPTPMSMPNEPEPTKFTTALAENESEPLTTALRMTTTSKPEIFISPAPGAFSGNLYGIKSTFPKSGKAPLMGSLKPGGWARKH